MKNELKVTVGCYSEGNIYSESNDDEYIKKIELKNMENKQTDGNENDPNLQINPMPMNLNDNHINEYKHNNIVNSNVNNNNYHSDMNQHNAVHINIEKNNKDCNTKWESIGMLCLMLILFVCAAVITYLIYQVILTDNICQSCNNASNSNIMAISDDIRSTQIYNCNDVSQCFTLSPTHTPTQSPI